MGRATRVPKWGSPPAGPAQMGPALSTRSQPSQGVGLEIGIRDAGTQSVPAGQVGIVHDATHRLEGERRMSGQGAKIVAPVSGQRTLPGFSGATG